MADGALSMFMSPEQYQLMQNNVQQQRALQFAQMDPMQQAQYGMFLGGSQLGGALARGLGGQDRQLTLISQRQALSQEIDPSNPESLLTAAQKAARMGDQEFAMNLAEYARKQQSEMALAQQRLRESKNAVAPDIQVAKYKGELMNQIAALEGDTSPEAAAQRAALQRQLDAIPTKGAESTNEIKNAEAMARAAGLKPGTPEYDKAVSENLNKLTAKGGNVKEVGVATGTREAVYVDPNTDQQFTYGKDKEGKQVRIPYFGGIDRTVSKTDVSMVNKAEGKFLEGMAGVDVERVKSAITARENAMGAIEDLDRLAQLDDKKLIGGSFAEGRVGATNLLNTLGLVSGKDADRLSASEQFTKTANDLVLKAIGGKLGAGISNADRDFIRTIVPQLETSAAARRELIKYMRNLNTKVVDETTRLETYAREKRTLGGYEPKIPLGSSGRSSLSNMTTEQLKAERDRLRGK